jgi:hypothetical protein
LRVDFQRPALDATRERFRALNALASQPNGYIETPHAMVAIANYLIVGIQSLKIRGDRAHRNQLCALDAADLGFPRLAYIHEQQFLAAIKAPFGFGWSYL